MVESIPKAAEQFSVKSLGDIADLNSLLDAAGSAIKTLESVVVGAVVAVGSEVGSLFSDAPGRLEKPTGELAKGAEESAEGSLGDQTEKMDSAVSAAGKAASGAAATATKAATKAAADARGISGVLLSPASQIFESVKKTALQALYADGLQAYAHIAKACEDIQNISKRAEDLASELIVDIAALVSLQGFLDYDEVTARNETFFGSARSTVENAIERFANMEESFKKQGKFDPGLLTAACVSMGDLSDTMAIGNTKLIEYEDLTKKIIKNMEDLRAIGATLPKIISSTINWIPKYVGSSKTGNLVNFVQTPLLKDGKKFLNEAKDKIKAVQDKGGVDFKTAIDISYDIAAATESVRAFICKLDPSNDIINAPEFQGLNTSYGGLVGEFAANDLTPIFKSIEEKIDDFFAKMGVGQLQDNSSQLSDAADDMIADLVALVALLGVVGPASSIFIEFVNAELLNEEARKVLGVDAMGELGAERSRALFLTDQFDELSTEGIENATTDGELAAAIAEQLKDMPEGHEKQELQKVYDSVYARSKSKGLGMAFMRLRDQLLTSANTVGTRYSKAVSKITSEQAEETEEEGEEE